MGDAGRSSIELQRRRERRCIAVGLRFVLGNKHSANIDGHTHDANEGKGGDGHGDEHVATLLALPAAHCDAISDLEGFSIHLLYSISAAFTRSTIHSTDGGLVYSIGHLSESDQQKYL